MTSAAIALCLAVLIAARRITGTWFHPSCVFAATWLVALVAASSIDGFPPVPFAALLIGVSVLAAAVAIPVHIRIGEVSPLTVECSWKLKALVWAGSIAGFASGLLLQWSNGVSIATATDLLSVARAAQSITAARYLGHLQEPTYVTLLQALAYASALAAPYAAEGARSKKTRAALLVGPTVGVAFYALFSTAKAPMTLAAAFTLASWFSVKVASAGGRPKVSARGALQLGATALVFLLGFTFFIGLRVGTWDEKLPQVIYRSFVTYSSGGIPAYESWVGTPGASDQVSGGAMITAGVSKFLVGDDLRGHAYAEFQPLLDGTTNVYTAWRPLTEDFTPAGAVLFLMLANVAAATCFRRSVTNRSTLASALLSVWYAGVLYSTTTSILSWTNVALAMVFGVWSIAKGSQFRAASIATHDSDDLAPTSSIAEARLNG